MELPPFDQVDFDKYRQSKPIIKVGFKWFSNSVIGMRYGPSHENGGQGAHHLGYWEERWSWRYWCLKRIKVHQGTDGQTVRTLMALHNRWRLLLRSHQIIEFNHAPVLRWKPSNLALQVLSGREWVNKSWGWKKSNQRYPEYEARRELEVCFPCIRQGDDTL